MSNSVPWKVRLGGFVAAKAMYAWMSTMKYRALFQDQSVDPRFDCERPRIYVFWHEYIMLPLYLRPHCNLTTLLSRHKDADILAQVAQSTGFGCVRGSTSKGGTAALMELSRQGEKTHLVLTPDGPRGPRRQLAIGPVYLAARLGVPIVPMGFGVDRPWRMKSWDRFAVPRPFSQARGVIGSEISIPTGLERSELEDCRLNVEQQLTELTVDAEAWAASGTSREGEIREKKRIFDPSQKIPSQGVISVEQADFGVSDRLSA